MSLTQWLFIAGIIMILLFLTENARSHLSLFANRYRIQSDKIPKAFLGKKIVFLSDLHNSEFGKNNNRLLQYIEKEKPDYIFVGGDMLVSKIGSSYHTALEFMKKLASQYTVICGNGNHEARLLWREEEIPEMGNIYREYIKEITEAGVIHLTDCTYKLEAGDEYIYVSDLELLKEYYKKFANQTLPLSYVEERLGDCKQDSFHVLLAHNPAYFDTYTQWGADLTLSGHVHGGIMRLPILGGVISPSYQLFPTYDAGLFEKNNRKMIISVGLGSHSIRIRLFNPPKIDVITLESM